MKIFVAPAGELADVPVWVCLAGPYMYESMTFLGLVRILLTEWENDNHLVG